MTCYMVEFFGTSHDLRKSHSFEAENNLGDQFVYFLNPTV